MGRKDSHTTRTNQGGSRQDFTPWLTTRDVQIAGAQAAFMLATGGTLKEACDHLNWPGPKQIPLRRLWWHLVSTAQFGEYLTALGRLTKVLERSATGPITTERAANSGSVELQGLLTTQKDG